MYCEKEHKRDDCPNCGAKEGAITGSTDWGNNFSCCSEACGKEITRKITINKNKKAYQKKLKKYLKLQNELIDMRLDGIDGHEFYIHADEVL